MTKFLKDAGTSHNFHWKDWCQTVSLFQTDLTCSGKGSSQYLANTIPFPSISIIQTRKGCGSRCREARWWWWSGCSWLQNTCTAMTERERECVCCGQMNLWKDGDMNFHSCPCIVSTWLGPVITMCTYSSASAVQAMQSMKPTIDVELVNANIDEVDWL